VVDYGELNISRSLEDLTNGTFIQVVDQPTFHYECTIHLKKKSVTLRFWKASIRKLESEHTFTAYILQNLLDAEFWDDYKTAAQDVESAILVDFQQRMRTEHNLNPPKKSTDSHYSRYKILADRDPYLNALRVNYGYAVTVHNAQGGEWDTVIVDPVNPARDGHSVQHHIDYTRWIYTASTRARRVVLCEVILFKGYFPRSARMLTRSPYVRPSAGRRYPTHPPARVKKMICHCGTLARNHATVRTNRAHNGSIHSHTQLANSIHVLHSYFFRLRRMYASRHDNAL
jgi:hypothetical protein